MIGEKEWLRWRKNGIGGSDAYTLKGHGFEGASIYDLYLDKIDKENVNEKTNYILELGKEAEPAIRSYFELKSGKDYPPKLFEKGYFLASLDGWHEESKEVLEIKLINQKDWLEAKEEKKIPTKYYIQMQHQLMVTEGERAWFVIYDSNTYKTERKIKNDGIVIVECLPDKAFQRELIDVEKDFWENHVLKKVPPKDDRKKEKIEVNLDEGYHNEDALARTVFNYKALKEKIEEDKKDLKLLEEAIKSVCIETKADVVKFKGSTFTKVERVGNVDYKKVPELKGVDLEPYRKKPSTYWKITIGE